MKLILRADMENLGKLGDIVAVKPGYGRNYLIPQGLAMMASKSNLKVFELERKKLQAKMDSLRSSASDLASKIAGATVTIEVRVGEGDKLYGSVTSAMIADGLEAQGIVVDRKKIVLDDPIRSIGVHEVEVKLHADVRGTIRVMVCRQGEKLIEETAAEESGQQSAEAEA
ncbi:50S ribosomal protein L9 [Fundidesulfovibrio terrae]|uniref:50S ribosomal protein L9 n=1 Tax=Fundidesulfovibrio terrae TaxID=2922866 RepID=UPI001FAF84F8|nr:50S ribosomal protein L9 [Fundidesulfovibrio terrae]